MNFAIRSFLIDDIEQCISLRVYNHRGLVEIPLCPFSEVGSTGHWDPLSTMELLKEIKKGDNYANA